MLQVAVNSVTLFVSFWRRVLVKRYRKITKSKKKNLWVFSFLKKSLQLNKLYQINILSRSDGKFIAHPASLKNAKTCVFVSKVKVIVKMTLWITNLEYVTQIYSNRPIQQSDSESKHCMIYFCILFNACLTIRLLV